MVSPEVNLLLWMVPPYMLEMNTNPGFSPASILPQQAKIYGISIKDLCGNEVKKPSKKNKIMKIAAFPGSFSSDNIRSL